jgi:hypothetical protein
VPDWKSLSRSGRGLKAYGIKKTGEGKCIDNSCQVNNTDADRKNFASPESGIGCSSQHHSRKTPAVEYSRGFTGSQRLIQRNLKLPSLGLRPCQVITSRYSSLSGVEGSGVEGSGRQFVSAPLNELKPVNLFFDNG